MCCPPRWSYPWFLSSLSCWQSTVSGIKKRALKYYQACESVTVNVPGQPTQPGRQKEGAVFKQVVGSGLRVNSCTSWKTANKKPISELKHSLLDGSMRRNSFTSLRWLILILQLRPFLTFGVFKKCPFVFQKVQKPQESSCYISG